MALRLFRRRTTQPPIVEAEAYARCHGGRTEDVRVVKVTKAEPRRPRYPALLSGEAIREQFEARLAGRSDES